jgi:threonine dehydratase
MIEFDDITRARTRIHAYTVKTPLFHSHVLSDLTKIPLHLKAECWQNGGSFKIRGALNYVAERHEDPQISGFVTCSSGNHGAALSRASSLFGGIPTDIFVPEGAEETKVAKIRRFGAEVHTGGKDFLAAYEKACAYAESEKKEYVHSHSHPLVIAGQGTIGLEIVEDMAEEPEAVIVPVGGGGLISGIATAVKEKFPRTRIIGVEAAAAPGAFLSFRDGYCHETVDIQPSLADGLLGTLTPLTYSIASRLVEKIVTVEEEAIRTAMRHFFDREQMVVEGGASVGLAALISGALDPAEFRGGPVVLVLTGRNVGREKFLSVVAPG